MGPLVAPIALGALQGLTGLFGGGKDRKLSRQQFEKEMAFRQKQLDLEKSKFGWDKDVEGYKLGQEDREIANKHANSNARHPLARQLMAALSRDAKLPAPMPGYDDMAAGRSPLGPTGGTGALVPGQPQGEPRWNERPRIPVPPGRAFDPRQLGLMR